MDAAAPYMTTPVLAGSALALLLTLLAMALGVGRPKQASKKRAAVKAKAAPAKALASPKPKASAAKKAPAAAAAAADDDVRRSARCGGDMRHFKAVRCLLNGADAPAPVSHAPRVRRERKATDKVVGTDLAPASPKASKARSGPGSARSPMRVAAPLRSALPARLARCAHAEPMRRGAHARSPLRADTRREEGRCRFARFAAPQAGLRRRARWHAHTLHARL